MSSVVRMLIITVSLMSFSRFALAIGYYLEVKFTSYTEGPGMPTEITLHEAYCMKAIGLGDHAIINGRASRWMIETRNEFSTQCYFVHSEVTYDMVYTNKESTKETAVRFTFYEYQGLLKEAWLRVVSYSPNISCFIHSRGLIECTETPPETGTDKLPNLIKRGSVKPAAE